MADTTDLTNAAIAYVNAVQKNAEDKIPMASVVCAWFELRNQVIAHVRSETDDAEGQVCYEALRAAAAEHPYDPETGFIHERQAFTLR